MLSHPTLDQLHSLGLHGMAKAFIDAEAAPEASSLTHAEWLALLLDRETALRSEKRLGARIRYAKLRQQATPEDIDYRASRSLDRALVQKLLTGTWIAAHESVLITGPTGIGKSWLACALGQKACRLNHSALYLRVPKLFSDLAMARGDGQYARIMRTVTRVEVLILDDWGLAPLDANARHDLLEILEERHGRRSTVVTSQLPVDRWHDIIGDPTYADAILDRLVHTAHRIALDGDSLRKVRTRGGIPKTS
jgi:DNA replication protein DnaC